VVLLPQGVTGFRDRGAGPLPRVDPRAVTALAHLVARLSGGRVGAISAPGATPNFFCAPITTAGEVVQILVNEIHPLVAAAFGSTMGAMVFMNAPAYLERAVELMPPFRLLSDLDLDRPFAGRDGENLTLSEQGQLRYWQPERLGDVIFNYWD
jgi:hypothetical protein